MATIWYYVHLFVCLYVCQYAKKKPKPVMLIWAFSLMIRFLD
ncbi:hypothetical protein M23134_01169 [Microscilla marina ATCC 23134]|uniref:Uncharacterized protein n=1 Tax=Microscilla marina ATCC 23134 TaxID=313606 RepID=A1ZFS1_MICM2|nr:hypothetical protein M23134_01169 [Microscilla marina ATCC 23134]